jgi:hypothetical protein
MDNGLRKLLERLAHIAEAHEEVYDSDVREAMRDAVFHGFLKRVPNFQMPATFETFRAEADQLVRDALVEYINEANSRADALGLGFRARYAAFQDEDVTVGPQQLNYGDFFGYTPPDYYDEQGNERQS